MTNLDKLLERAVLHIKHGTAGMCVGPQEIVKELIEFRKKTPKTTVHLDGSWVRITATYPKEKI